MRIQHLGLRAQIVLSLAALLAVVFSFTGMALLWVLRESVSSQQLDFVADAAQTSVETLAERLRGQRNHSESERILESNLGRAGIVALFHFDEHGEQVASAALEGQGNNIDGIEPRRPRPFRTTRPARNGHGEELIVIVPIGRSRGFIAAIVSAGASEEELGRVARPILIYLATSGILLLGFGYVALTNLIVRPLEELTRTAEQVALGRFDVKAKVSGGREIATAGRVFNSMIKQIKAQKDRLEDQLDELKRTTEELSSTQDQLVRSAKLASVGSLAAGVAHEVGNPVSAILGLAEVIEEGDLESEENKEYIERIRREAERVNRIIGDLLEYSRPSSDDQDGPCSVFEGVDAAVGLMSPQKKFKNIDIRLSIDEDLPDIDIGADQLTQVLVNILLNASDALDEAGEEGQVEIKAQLSDENFSKNKRFLQIDVSDNGPGVKEDLIEHLFEPFFTTKDPGQGTGLGLALCEGIVSRAGGFLKAKNNEQKGLTITICLPASE